MADGALVQDGLRFPDLIIHRGYAAPVRIEGDVYDLEVIGRIPDGLNGGTCQRL